MAKKTTPPPAPVPPARSGANGAATRPAGREPTPAEARLLARQDAELARRSRAATPAPAARGGKATHDDDEELPIKSGRPTAPTKPEPPDKPDDDDDDDDTEESEDIDTDDDDDDDDDEPKGAPGKADEAATTELPIMAMGSDARATGKTLALAYIAAIEAADVAAADYYRWLTERGIKGSRKWHRLTDEHNGDTRFFKAGRKGKIVEKGAGPDVELID
jgi:hypothetical protein